VASALERTRICTECKSVSATGASEFNFILRPLPARGSRDSVWSAHDFARRAKTCPRPVPTNLILTLVRYQHAAAARPPRMCEVRSSSAHGFARGAKPWPRGVPTNLILTIVRYQHAAAAGLLEFKYCCRLGNSVAAGRHTEYVIY